ncbi:MAG: hypothetical protein AB7K86_24240 [Rhodospirillales bacterium]
MKAHYFPVPERRPLELIETTYFQTLFAGISVNPARPTLRAALRLPATDGREPLLHIEVTPADHAVLEVGWLDEHDLSDSDDFDTVARLPFPSCPSIVLPSVFIHPDRVIEVTARWLASMPHASTLWAAIKRHLGDPYGRISAIDDDGEPWLRLVADLPPSPPLGDGEARAFARYVLTAEHLAPEISALHGCWEASLEIQRKHGIAVDARMSLAAFRALLGKIMGTCHLPDHPDAVPAAARATAAAPRRQAPPPEAAQRRSPAPPAEGPVFLFHDESRERSMDDFDLRTFTTFLFGAAVHAFRPSVCVVGADGTVEPGRPVPLVRIAMTPFGYQLHDIGRVVWRDRPLSFEEAAVLCRATPETCPTLVAVGMLIGDPVALQLAAEWIAPCDDGGRTWAAIRAHPGAPRARVQAAIDALVVKPPNAPGLLARLLGRAAPKRDDNPVLTDEAALSYAQYIMTEEHFMPELAELGATWDHAVAVQQSIKDGYRADSALAARDAMTMVHAFLSTTRLPPAGAAGPG